MVDRRTRHRRGRCSRTLLAGALALTVGLIPAQASAFPYSEDFEGAVGPEWSSQGVDTSPTGHKFLGQFGEQTVNLSLAGIPGHTSLRISLDLHIIGSMDGSSTVTEGDFAYGPDVFTVALDGAALKTTTFSNVKGSEDYRQAYPGDHPGDLNAAGTGASATNLLGYPANNGDPDRFFGDTTYHLEFDVPHSGAGATLAIVASGVLDPGHTLAEDESWGVDNVAVSSSTTGPTVTFDRAPSGPGNAPTAVIEFHSGDPAATFQCKLDIGAFAPCASPHLLEDLATGSHTFTVIAKDPNGDESPPESVTWEVGAFDCSNSIVIAFARACGVSLAETEAGSEIYKTADRAWVGGFELVPRFGGELVVDVPARELRAEGAGVDLQFAGFTVPFDLAAIPIRSAAGDFAFNQAGTFEKQVFKLPIAGNAKVFWTDGGSSATFEGEIALEKFLGPFARFEVGASGAKLSARLRNGVGFDLGAAEVKIPEISATTKNLATPRALKLKELLLKYELRDGKHAWEGGATVAFPIAKSTLELAGRASFLDGSLGGAAIKVGGLNTPIPDTPLFLQAVEGGLAFNPKWGFDLGVEATLGPEVADRKLIKFNGNIRAGALAAGCTSTPDAAEVTLKGDFPALADLGVGSAKVEGTSCLPTTSLAMQTKLRIELVLGVSAQMDALLAGTSQVTGWISRNGASLEGSSTVKLPLLPLLQGANLVSTKGIATCADLAFFSGGVAYPWLGIPKAFTGCDLAPWKIPVSAAGVASAAGGGKVRVGRGLPFVGFSAAATKRPPRLRVVGPRGQTFTAPANGQGRISRNVVFAPVPSENRTYVFVRRPSPGRWRVIGVDRPIRGIRSARGLDKPKITVKISRVKGSRTKRRLVYEIRPIPGQKVRFYDRADGVAKALGRPTSRRRGKIVFTPGTSPDRSHAIEAMVTTGRLPRATLTVTRFRLPR